MNIHTSNLHEPSSELDDDFASDPRIGVEIAKNFLQALRRTRWARKGRSPVASKLGRQLDNPNDISGIVSGREVIEAARELGIPIVEVGKDALIGVVFPEEVSSSNGETADPLDQFRFRNIEFIAATAPPPDREDALSGRIPLRNVALFSGAGGIGKSLLTTQLACATVLGQSWLGNQPMPGPVIYFAAEDDEDEIRRRLSDIAITYDATVDELIGNGLHITSYAGDDMVLARFDEEGTISPTRLFNSLWHQAQKILPVLIIIDTRDDAYDGDENNRRQTTAFTGLMRQLAVVSNSAVVLISHPSQSGTRSGDGLSGSSAWHGKVRSRLFMRRATKDEGGTTDPDLVVLEQVKYQYGPLAPKMMLRFRNGVFVEADGGPEPKAADQHADQLFLELLDRFERAGRNVTDKTGRSYAPALFATEPEARAARIDKKAFAAAMGRLFTSEQIRVVTEGPASRRRSRIVR